MAAVRSCDFLKLLTLFILSYSSNCLANDILGCGGFVQSHVNLDYSKIEIGLYTKSGILKEKTECAPKNGYYFLPLYEKGDYVLKVHPPAGWSFEPSTVEVSVDGVTDKCSVGQDINFAFNGFGITGSVVTAGQPEGPAGISVQLVNEKGEIRETVTSARGAFHFTPVIPGKYTIKASHPRWKLDPAQTTVQVKEGNTQLPIGVLAVKGYDVKGSVTSFGSPITGLHVLLYSKQESQKLRVEGCKTALLQGVPDAPICYSVTDSSGEFSFGLVPAGEYKLLAMSKSPGQAAVSFNIKPETIDFTVRHDSQFIKNAFDVTGYTVTGSVVASKGAPLAGARVLLDGKPEGVTDKNGKYTLASLQPGSYPLMFQHEQCEFDESKVTIYPTGSVVLDEVAVARWKVCGEVTPEDPRSVVISNDRGALVKSVVIKQGDKGKWCTFLAPGVYTAKVDVSDAEQRDGLQFYPQTQKILVQNKPVSEISFSQLKAEVRGEAKCAGGCGALDVTLTHLSNDGAYQGTPLLTKLAADGTYVFSGVPLGSVSVRIGGEARCWDERLRNVPVTGRDVRVPTFTQTGYAIQIVNSHDSVIEYKSATGSPSGQWSLPAGRHVSCVPDAGVYSLRAGGCHVYRTATATVRTSDAQVPTVTFEAIAHEATIAVSADVDVSDLTIKVQLDGKATVYGPLKPEKIDGQYIYKQTVHLAPGSVSLVSCWSQSLVFPAPAQLVGAAGCGAQLAVAARRAVVVAGQTVPAVQGVEVTLVAGEEKLTVTTGPDGKYSFGPIDASKQYTVTAAKDSYEMGTALPNGDIPARKLAEIVITLKDKDTGEVLEGGLISVSGGSFRRNALSPLGPLTVGALRPGDYHVKPLLKEYRFTPQRRDVDLADGQRMEIEFSGSRVSWSVLGRVVSVCGGGLGAQLRADSLDGQCEGHDGASGADGYFRIRGLLPSCSYRLVLKAPEQPDEQPLRLALTPPIIQIKNKQDVTGITLVAVSPSTAAGTDSSVTIHSTAEHLKTLRLSLSLGHAPSPLYTVRPPSPPPALLPLPRLPADNQTYTISIESTLSKATHSYEDIVLTFTADGQFKRFEVDFFPKVKSSEQELRQSSLFVLPLILLASLIYWQREAIILALQQRAAKAKARPTPEYVAPVTAKKVTGKKPRLD